MYLGNYFFHLGLEIVNLLGFTFDAFCLFTAFDFFGWPGKSLPGLQLSSSLDQDSATV